MCKTELIAYYYYYYYFVTGINEIEIIIIL